jgi:hypothetical protein
MLKKKCPSCAKKIERKFNFCPHCGESFKKRSEQNNFGLLGRSDSGERVQEELKLPFGMNKIVNSLMKQLENQMNTGNSENAPRGFKVKISTGNPQIRQIAQGETPETPDKTKEEAPKISQKQMEEWGDLPRVEAESKVRRLANSIIYEIKTPGVRTKNNVVITELASGLEIRAYSKDKCYVKTIPLKVEVIEYHLEKDRLFLELKG